MKKAGLVLLTGLLSLQLCACADKTAADIGAVGSAGSESEIQERTSGDNASFWAVCQGEVFDSSRSLTWIKESLDTFVWIALRDGDYISEAAPAEDYPWIAESVRVMEGSEEVGDGSWIRLVQESFVPEEGSMGQTAHKDYIFYREGADACVGIQSPKEEGLWTVLKMENYGEWLEKEIWMYIRMTTGLSLTTEESLTESGDGSSEAKQPLDACSVLIGDAMLSIYESKEDILAKLEEAGVSYKEYKPDNPEEVNYDSYYSFDNAWAMIYFSNDTCVRMRLVFLEPDDSYKPVRTTSGLCPGSTYSQMEELYGNPDETHAYAGKELYTIYRYPVGSCICEFGIPGEDRDAIYNVDIYDPDQSPIYEYGEEL